MYVFIPGYICLNMYCILRIIIIIHQFCQSQKFRFWSKTYLFPTFIVLFIASTVITKKTHAAKFWYSKRTEPLKIIRNVKNLEYMKVLSQFPEYFFMLCWALNNSKFSHVPKQLWPLKSRSMCQIFHDKDFLFNSSPLFPTARIRSALPLGSAFFAWINTISNKNSV